MSQPLTEPIQMLRRNLAGALAGVVSHVDPHRALDGVDWQTAGRRPPGLPHSIFQLVAHMSVWQDWSLRARAGDSPPLPGPDENWPPGPAPRDAAEWETTRARFLSGLEASQAEVQEADLDEVIEAAGETFTRADALRVIGSHNSYHLGQAVLVRQALGEWV